MMCCLKYEQEAYEDLHKTSPKAESFVDTPDGRGTVTEVNLLRQSVKVRLEQQPDTIVCHKNCDICVLRNGKAKKNDEPIPDDLAPISGGKKKETEKPMFSTYLEPVVVRSGKSADSAEAPEQGEEVLKHRNRRNKNKKSEGKTAETVQNERAAENKPMKSEKKRKDMQSEKKTRTVAVQEKKSKPDDAEHGEPGAEEKIGKKPRNHYRRYHRHRKPNGPKAEG